MLFVEADAPLVKAWIVKRLENNSDADADVLADYVLALLKHDGDVEAIRKLFEEEIPDFLREDAAAFTDDVLQAVKYRSYLPGARPAPPTTRKSQHTRPVAPPSTASRSDHMPPPMSLYHPSAPYPAPPASLPFSQSGSRKRARREHDDGDVEIIINNQAPHTQPHKQPRRGYAPRGYRGPLPFPTPPTAIPYGAPLPFLAPPIDPNSILENIQILQSLLPPTVDLPSSVYSGTAVAPFHWRKQRCRDYDTKGYCSRGSSCNFEHGAQSFILPPMPTTVDEYDPSNATLSLPPYGVQPPPARQQLDVPNFQLPPPTSRREPKKPRRIKGRAPVAASGPSHDRSKTTIVVQNIPSENFTEDQVRGYFSQFGDIVEVSIQSQNRLATVNFDSWEAASAAWSSPKVIFDNRFVKVYWYKDEASDETTVNRRTAKDATNGHKDETTSARVPAIDPEIDMEEFYRKQFEAQKVYDEKLKKRQEIELERQELEERQKKLRDRQAEAKRQLRAKLNKANGIKDDVLSSSGISALNENREKKPSGETEALRAQLAALEHEANQLGIDPDDNHDDALSWAPLSRGRGRGFRGRGTFAPRAVRATYGYRGRGGAVEARHAAYAAYSLDNRPKVVALCGVDFTVPGNDEALRQYLFSVGEFQEVHAAPAITHVIFKDRKTAEKFMFGVSASNSIHGIEGKIDPAWAKTSPGLARTGEGPTVNALEDEQDIKGKMDTSADGVNEANGQLEEGEIDNTPDHDEGDMDYEAGEW